MAEDSFWDYLSGLGQSASGAGRWLAPEVVPSFTFVERMRQALPEDEESPEATAALTAWRSQHRGSGLGGVWRGPDDTVLSPPLLALRSIAADPSTGNVVAAGHLDYESWGIRINAPSWLLIDGLYVGSLLTRTLLPLDLVSCAGSSL